MQKGKIVLFGATGFTGHLVAEEMVQRGLRPLLCGRKMERLQKASARLGHLETAVATADDGGSLAALLNKGDILVSTVGPFVRHGRTALNAAIQKGALYIDSTGEPAFIQEIFETYGPAARAAGTALIPACGYDYIPGNLAAGIALGGLGAKATRVDVGYFGSLEMSQGTAASMRQALTAPVMVYRSGKMHQEYGGTRVRRFLIDGSGSPGLSISGTEHFSLPRLYPSLQEVNTYLGWFGGMTYLVQYMALFQSLMVKMPGYRALADYLATFLPESRGKGPDAVRRKRHSSYVVAEAFDLHGTMSAREDLEGIDGYSFTAKMIAWAADRASQGKVSQTGALGPIEAFGLNELLEGCAQSGIHLKQPA